MPDIAEETLKVGNALTSVRIDQMIVNMAKGIAEGQFLLDQQGIEHLKIMGVPGTIAIGNEKLSMIEAGFIPSFYQFVDTIIELKMEVKIRMETTDSTAVKEDTSASVSVSASADYLFGSASVSASAAYARSVDTKHSQTYSQDLSAQSLMRTKLVPVPAPEPLIERIRIILDNLKEELKKEREAIKEKGGNENDIQAAIDAMTKEKMKAATDRLKLKK